MANDFVKTPISVLTCYAIILLFAFGPFFGFFLVNYLDVVYYYAMVAICAIGVILILLNDFRIRIPLYLGFFIAFTLYTVLSDILLVDKILDAKYFYTNRLIGTVLILIIIENTPITKRFFETLFTANHAVLIIAFIVIIIQQLFDNLFFVNPVLHEILGSREYSNTRLPSIYSWVGAAGILGLAYMPVLGCQISHHMRNKMKGVVILFLMGAVVAFISKSRFIMLNYLLLLFLIPAYKGINIGATFKYAIIVIAFLFVGYQGVKMAGVDVERIISERILEEDRGGILSGSAGTRILAFRVFSDLYWQNPVFGKGKFHAMGEASEDDELVRMLAGRSSQIHVGYLSLLYYYGMVGGLIFLAFLFQMSRDYYKLGKKTLYWGPFFAILQFLFTNLTGVYFHMLIMGMVLAIVYARYYQLQEEAEESAEVQQIEGKEPEAYAGHPSA